MKECEEGEVIHDDTLPLLVGRVWVQGVRPRRKSFEDF